MTRLEQSPERYARGRAMLDDDQLFDELLNNPSDSDRYPAAFAELVRRTDEETDDGSPGEAQ